MKRMMKCPNCDFELEKKKEKITEHGVVASESYKCENGNCPVNSIHVKYSVYLQIRKSKGDKEII